jgi:hypothetical protein
MKLSCLGCLGLILLVLVGLGIIMLTAWWQIRGEETAAAESTYDVDGRMTLDLETSWVLVELRAGEPGEPLTVRAEYDGDRYLYEEESSTDEEGRPVLRVALAPRGSRVLAAFRPVVGGSYTKLDITVPPDVPLRIRASINGSISLFRLGGLSLVDADLHCGGGIMQVAFHEPTAAPVENLRTSCNGGNLVLYYLGNASPRRFTAHQTLGAVNLHLPGEWRNDSVIRITTAMSTGQLWVPSGANILGLEEEFGPIRIDGTREVPPPSLRFDLDRRFSLLQFTEPQETSP